LPRTRAARKDAASKAAPAPTATTAPAAHTVRDVIVAHADWGVDPRKQWVAVATGNVRDAQGNSLRWG